LKFHFYFSFSRQDLILIADRKGAKNRRANILRPIQIESGRSVEACRMKRIRQFGETKLKRFPVGYGDGA